MEQAPHARFHPLTSSHEHDHVEWVDPVEYRNLAAAVVPTIDRDDNRAIGESLLRQLDALLASTALPTTSNS